MINLLKGKFLMGVNLPPALITLNLKICGKKGRAILFADSIKDKITKQDITMNHVHKNGQVSLA